MFNYLAPEQTLSVTNYVAETAEAVGDWLSATGKEAQHETLAQAHKLDKEVNKEIAKDSDAALTDRAKAAGKAVKAGVEQSSEESKKEYQSLKAKEARGAAPSDPTDKGILENIKDYVVDTAESVGDWLSATTKEAKHATLEEEHKVERKVNTEVVKDSDVSITERAKAAGRVIKEGAQELNEGAKKEAQAKKAEHAFD